MEKFQEAREQARRNLKVADHMAFITYPLVKDNKLLLAIMENIFLALTNSLSSLLYYERLFKNIPPFHDNFDSKLHMFRERCLDRHKLSKEYVELMLEIKNIIMEHKRSPVEFSRNQGFVICTEGYQIRKISIGQIRSHIEKTKKFLGEVEEIVKKDEDIFSRRAQ